ncbi:hypothetical protein HF086_002621, partial [Spodoptera exigua]
PRSRRVQAQRKFAQGAYVPPNAAAVAAVDHRRDAAQDARNVTINNMTATSLLDVVSLQGLHTHLQPVVVVERLRETNPCKDVTRQEKEITPPTLQTNGDTTDKSLVSEIFTKPHEFLMDDADDAFSGDNESNADMQLRFEESPISIESGPEDVDFDNDDTVKCCTNGNTVKVNNETSPRVDEPTLINLIKSETNDKRLQPNEKHNSNKEVAADGKESSCTGKESSGKNKELFKEHSTKSKNNTKGKVSIKGKVISKSKDNTKCKVNKGKGSSAKGNGVSKGSRNKAKQPRINDENSLASVLRSLQKAADKNAQKTHIMSLRKRRLSNGRLCATTARKIHTLRGKNVTSNKKKTESSKPHSSSEFSVDDNRPLTYYAQNNKANKKSPKKRNHYFDSCFYGPVLEALLPGPSSTKKIILEPYVPPPSGSLIPKRLQNQSAEPVAGPSGLQRTLEPVAGPSGLQRHSTEPGPSGLQRKTFEPVAGSSALQRLASEPVVGPSGLQRLTLEPVAGPSGLQRMKPAPVAGPSGLQRLTSEPVAGPSGIHKRVLRNPRISRGQSVEQQDIQILAGLSVLPCVAAKWGTVQQVINATKEEMDTRCATCVACLRIDKLIKLSKLLHRLDLTGTNNQATAESEPENDDEYDNEPKSPEEDTGHVYLDLFPKHPRLMMKLRIHEVHGKQLLSACLIPKNDARKNNEDFLLEEKEHLLDQLINTLTISLPGEILNFDQAQIDDAPHSVERVQGILSRPDRVNEPGRAHPVEVHRNVQVPQANVQVPRAAVQSQVVERHMLNNVYEEGDDADNDANSDDDEEDDDYDRRERDERISAEDLNESSADAILQMHPVGGVLQEGPVFRPTKEEFKNPMEYFMKIWDQAYEFGICKIIPPPGWKPKCQSCEGIRFDVAKQYISRMFNRWGTAMRELACIKFCASRANGIPCRTPMVRGMEINMPKLYHLVQRHGGLELVLNKKRWLRVGRDMNFPRNVSFLRRLDQLYVKYLLPYDSLAPNERRELFGIVEKAWSKKNQRLLDRALNPLRAQRRMLGLTDTEEEPEEQSPAMAVVKEAEDCIVRGPIMNYTRFKEISEYAYNIVYGYSRENNPMSLEEKEELYWRYVVQGNEHICVHTAAIDTGSDPSRGSSRTLTLKDISQNKENVLRFLGAVSGLTAPTLNLGMAFSTNCFYMDPHTLPWLDMLYKGDPRIWYAIPSKQTDNFRKAVNTLCPSFCQKKSLWLSTDIAMIPPQLLREYNVSVTRVVQEDNEIILAFPHCYTSSINTGYSESESIYFAPVTWLHTVYEVFKEARESCEPTMFSLEELLLRIGKASGVDRATLRAAQPVFDKVLRDEITNRLILQERGMKIVHQPDIPKPKNTGRRRRRNRTFIQEECEYCRATLFFSKVTGLVRNSYLCLEHALNILNVKKMPITEDVQIITKVTIEELNHVNDDMKRRIENGEESAPSDSDD